MATNMKIINPDESYGDNSEVITFRLSKKSRDRLERLAKGGGFACVNSDRNGVSRTCRFIIEKVIWEGAK